MLLCTFRICLACVETGVAHDRHDPVARGSRANRPQAATDADRREPVVNGPQAGGRPIGLNMQGRFRNRQAVSVSIIGKADFALGASVREAE